QGAPLLLGYHVNSALRIADTTTSSSKGAPGFSGAYGLPATTVKRAGSSRCGRWIEDCCGSSRGLSGPKGEKDPPDTAADNLTVGSLCRPLTFRVKTAVYSRHEGRPAGGGSKAEPEQAARVDRGPVGHARGARPPCYT